MIDIYKLKPSESYSSNCYLISSCGEYALIDPSAELADSLAKYPAVRENLKFILLTHAHFDHMLTINEWTSVCGRILVGAEDAAALSDAELNCYLGFLGIDDGYYGDCEIIKDGDTLQLGDETIEVIGCPGHTPGGLSYKLGDKIFCGDTVFAKGGYGRCDLPGGDIEQLEKTLIKLITHINDATFYPGHGENTTLRELVYYFM